MSTRKIPTPLMRVDEGLNRDGCEAGGEAPGDSSDAEHGLAVSDEALSSDGRYHAEARGKCDGACHELQFIWATPVSGVTFTKHSAYG